VVWGHSSIGVKECNKVEDSQCLHLGELQPSAHKLYLVSPIDQIFNQDQLELRERTASAYQIFDYFSPHCPIPVLQSRGENASISSLTNFYRRKILPGSLMEEKLNKTNSTSYAKDDFGSTDALRLL
jgi:hypothetical protein